jgi:hypothetical protein
MVKGILTFMIVCAVAFASFVWLSPTVTVIVLFIWVCRIITKAQGSHSESKGADGKLKNWSFKGTEFSIHIDFQAQQLTLTVPQPSVLRYTKSGEIVQHDKNSTFDVTLPLRGFSCEKTEQITKERFIRNTGTGTVDGKVITLNLPGGTFTNVPTGYSWVTFEYLARLESVDQNGRIDIHNDFNNQLRVIPQKTRDKTVALFKKHWMTAKNRIDEINVIYHADFTERQKTASNEASERIKKQKDTEAEAAKQAAERAKASARARWNALSQEAGIEGDFTGWTYDDDGAIIWLVAADRNGKGLIVCGKDIWMGMYSGANAKIIPGDAVSRAQAQLEVELPDPTFEREHLKKRRHRIMKGCTDDLLQEWCDRINILA